MNKQTIQDVDARLEELHRKLMRTVRAIDELRSKRRKMVAGKIKVPPPKPVKVMFRDLPFNDGLPDFADRPVAPGTDVGLVEAMPLNHIGGQVFRAPPPVTVPALSCLKIPVVDDGAERREVAAKFLEARIIKTGVECWQAIGRAESFKSSGQDRPSFANRPRLLPENNRR